MARRSPWPVGATKASAARRDGRSREAQRAAAPAEVAYYRAVSRWSSHRLAEAEEIVEAALPAARDVHRARLLQLLGWIDVRSGELRRCGAAIQRRPRRAQPREAARRARSRTLLINALGIIAAETIDLRLGRLVRREYESEHLVRTTRASSASTCSNTSHGCRCSRVRSAARGTSASARLSLTVDTSYHASALTSAANIAGIGRRPVLRGALLRARRIAACCAATSSRSTSTAASRCSRSSRPLRQPTSTPPAKCSRSTSARARARPNGTRSRATGASKGSSSSPLAASYRIIEGRTQAGSRRAGEGARPLDAFDLPPARRGNGERVALGDRRSPLCADRARRVAEPLRTPGLRSAPRTRHRRGQPAGGT